MTKSPAEYTLVLSVALASANGLRFVVAQPDMTITRIKAELDKRKRLRDTIFLKPNCQNTTNCLNVPRITP